MPADTIPAHYTTEFSTNWINRVAQMTARLDAAATDESFAGERKRYDRIGTLSSHVKTARKAATTAVNPDTDSRWAYRTLYELPVILDKDDALNLGRLVTPNSNIIQHATGAYNRDKDDILVAAALAAAKTGEDGTGTTAFPSSNQLAAGGSGLSLTKLLSAREILDAADIEDEYGAAPRFLVCSAQQITNLLNTTEVKSSDYNTVKALASGQVDTFMGFRFVVKNRLPKASTTRSCVAIVKGSVRRIVGAMEVDIGVRRDLSLATQIFCSWNLGAVRVCDEGVVQIDCTES